MIQTFKIFYRSIPSNTSKYILYRALDSSTAELMFAEKYESADMEVPSIDKILILDAAAKRWLPVINAEDNL